MPALSAHLRDPDTHARLSFHPGCPICRSERLSGTLCTAPLVSPRARAALATGVLTVATVSPAATFAREPDTAQDGTADATQPVTGDGAHQPDFDGGARDQSPEAGNGAPVDEPASETANPDDEPIVDPDAGPVPQNPRTQPAPPPPPSSTPAAPAAPAAGATDAVDAASPAANEPAPAQAPASTMMASAAASGQPVLTVRARAPKPTTKAQVPANAASQPVATAAPAPAPTRPTPPSDAADPSARAHTVQAGESLWSIASARLGPGAGPAQIAREVHRLWQLNADRIGTGDPDLLMVGTRLRLR